MQQFHRFVSPYLKSKTLPSVSPDVTSRITLQKPRQAVIGFVPHPLDGGFVYPISSPQVFFPTTPS